MRPDAPELTSGRPLTVVVVGGGPRAASLLRLLNDLDVITIGALCATSPDGPAFALADEIGVHATTQLASAFDVPDLDLVIDIADDPRVSESLTRVCPTGVEVVGSGGTMLVWDLLVARKRGEEQERLLAELQTAYEKISSHERRLNASTAELERANEELEGRLAEIYFTHEFFRALTRYTSVEDVCSLVVDGLNGILGAEISCVYLLDQTDWTLRLRAGQGRPSETFRASVPAADTILGQAFKDGPVQEPAVEPGAPSAAWVTDAGAVRSQAAVPLLAGENVIGVMVVGSSSPRELTGAEMDRLVVLGNQSSLSLQNALLLSQLERLSVSDRLTQLYNHVHFHQRLDEEFNRSVRFGHDLSLIMLDIDDFKRLNDTYGHPCGDEVLRAVSGIIKSSLRDMDMAARYGGDEFVVMLPETGTAGALAVAERIRADVAEKVVSPEEGDDVRFTVSVGVANHPLDAATAHRLVEAADNAMYVAKRTGKNRVETATPRNITL